MGRACFWWNFDLFFVLSLSISLIEPTPLELHSIGLFDFSNFIWFDSLSCVAQVPGHIPASPRSTNKKTKDNHGQQTAVWELVDSLFPLPELKKQLFYPWERQ